MNLKLLTGALPVFLAASLSAQQLTTELVASGFSVPLDAKSPPGDYERIFVAQRNGTVRIIKNGTLLATPFKVLPDVQSGGEQGLLGIAFHPDFQNNGYFYASYTHTGGGDNRIRRWTATGDVTASGSRRDVFGPVSQPFSNHNGGCIQFGPDGFLYFGIGDGGSGQRPRRVAPRTATTHLGKILRLDVSTTASRPAFAEKRIPFVQASADPSTAASGPSACPQSVAVLVRPRDRRPVDG